MSERKPLNLDELYGTARPVIVVWQEKRYELRRPEGMTPVEYSRWTKLQAKTSKLIIDDADEMSEEQAHELEEAIHMTLSLVSPELAEAGLTFAAQVRVLQFYTDEITRTEKEAAGKESPKNSTGA